VQDSGPGTEASWQHRAQEHLGYDGIGSEMRRRGTTLGVFCKTPGCSGANEVSLSWIEELLRQGSVGAETSSINFPGL